jgi:hypothetical protein
MTINPASQRSKAAYAKTLLKKDSVLMAKSVSSLTALMSWELTLMSIIHTRQNHAMHSSKRVTANMDTDATLSIERQPYLMWKANGKTYTLSIENFSEI